MAPRDGSAGKEVISCATLQVSDLKTLFFLRAARPYSVLFSFAAFLFRIYRVLARVYCAFVARLRCGYCVSADWLRRVCYAFSSRSVRTARSVCLVCVFFEPAVRSLCVLRQIA